MSDEGTAADQDRGPSWRPWRAIFVLLVVVAAIWATQLRGLVSSNDGSHVALARALALRSQPEIDPEVMLTLLVDRAQRDGHEYSDRPPGTAFAALPAVRVAVALDERWEQASLQRMRAQPPPERIDDALVFTPASQAYAATYGSRRQETSGRSPNLLSLQGTAALVGAHTIALGLAGLLMTLTLVRRAGGGLVAQIVSAGVLGLATLWGPYSTVLFSHVTAGLALALLVYALERVREATTPKQVAPWGLVAGAAGSWAVSADYALLLAVVPLTIVGAPWRRWPAIALGAIPVTLATLAYHDAAFGSPFSIGYDHQTNFEFARERGSTFAGNPFSGLWTLWGAGRGAGVLVQSPIVLVGVYGLATSDRRWWLYGLLPWMALLVFHQTPWGGATLDHRYLAPALPVLSVGLGQLWRRYATDESGRARWVALAIIVLAAVSAILTWASFWAWSG